MSPSLDPGTVKGNSAELRKLWKRSAPEGWALPPRTSPESASNFSRDHVAVFVNVSKDLSIYFLVLHFLSSKRLPDSLLKSDALSGLVRGGGVRSPGALLHHSARSV